MTYFITGESVSVPTSAPPVERALIVQEESLIREFLDSLTPDQMTKLVLTNALAKAFGFDAPEEVSQERSFPQENFRKGFDFDAWKKRRGPKIR